MGRAIYRDTDKTIEVDDATGEQYVTWTNPAASGAILDAIRATAAAAHTEGEPWVQPTGAHDAYPLGYRVTYGGKTWESLIGANVWTPGGLSWREVSTGGTAPAWVQPTGSTDAYPLGAKVTHKSKTWTSTVAANVWEPGVYGWVQTV